MFPGLGLQCGADRHQPFDEPLGACVPIEPTRLRHAGGRLGFPAQLYRHAEVLVEGAYAMLASMDASTVDTDDVEGALDRIGGHGRRDELQRRLDSLVDGAAVLHDLDDVEAQLLVIANG